MDGSKTFSKRCLLVKAFLIAAGLAVPARPGDVSFVRGDVNGDGVVSISDAYYLQKYLSWYGPPPACWQAADADNDADVDSQDAYRISRYVLLDGLPLDPPFPEPGPAEPPKGLDGWLNCASSGNGAPVVDPAAKIEILDATTPGGEGKAKMVVAISSSVPIAGCYFRLSFDGGLFERSNGCEVKDLWWNSFTGYPYLLGEGELKYGFWTKPGWLEAGENVPVWELTFCLKEGVLPGDYPITLEAGEFVHSDSGQAIHPVLDSGTLTLLSALNPASGCPPDPSVGGPEFVRGDSNSDGTVSISDAYFIANYLFEGGPISECLFTNDVDNNGAIQLTDVIRILAFLFLGESQPAAPYPSPGRDDGANFFWGVNPCPSYRNGSPLQDRTAKLEVLDAVAPGGDDSMATITLAVSSSTSLAGYAGTILADPAVFRSMGAHKGTDLTGTFREGFNSIRVRDGLLKFGFLSALFSPDSIPAGENAQVLEIGACLKEGLPIGQYPLTLVDGELVDEASGRAIHPVLHSGTLTVLSRISNGAACTIESDSKPPVPATPPPPPVEPHVQFMLLGASALPGTTLSMPFVIHSNAPIQGLSFSVDFDEEALRIEALRKLSGYPDTKYGFERLETNNWNDNAGSAGVDEGFIVGAVVFNLQDPVTLPANEDVSFLGFEFLVKPEAKADATEVRFLDGGRGTGQPVTNNVTVEGNTVYPDTSGSFVFTNGVVTVLPEITTFVRGDSNGDGAVDISDAQHTLGYLFLGTERPPCYDAADADDSGYIDIGDPIFTLTALFLSSGKRLPPPYPAEGEDPTPDRLGCLHQY